MLFYELNTAELCVVRLEVKSAVSVCSLACCLCRSTDNYVWYIIDKYIYINR